MTAGIVQDTEFCRLTAHTIRGDLIKAVFVVNDEKSVWEPTQNLDWLGINWNSILGTLQIVDRRITKIINTINCISEAGFKRSPRKLASFTGQLFLLAL